MANYVLLAKPGGRYGDFIEPASEPTLKVLLQELQGVAKLFRRTLSGTQAEAATQPPPSTDPTLVLLLQQLAEQQRTTNELLAKVDGKLHTVTNHLAVTCEKLDKLSTHDPVKEATAQRVVQLLEEAREAQGQHQGGSPVEVRVVMPGGGGGGHAREEAVVVANAGHLEISKPASDEQVGATAGSKAATGGSKPAAAEVGGSVTPLQAAQAAAPSLIKSKNQIKKEAKKEAKRFWALQRVKDLQLIGAL